MKDISESLTIFEGRKIRRMWDEKEEKWFFSVIDIVAILTADKLSNGKKILE